MWGSLISMAPAINQMGYGMRQGREGAGSYDISTGQYYDPDKVERGFLMGTMSNPMKVIKDPNMSTKDKLAVAASFVGIGPWGMAGAKKRYRENLEAENARMAAKYNAIGDKISGLTEYQTSPEAQQKLAALEQSGADIKGMAGEATDIARSRVNQEAPGAQIERKDIRQAVAEKMSAIQESGGSGSLSAITKVGLEEQSALRGLAKENYDYKIQAQKDLSNALMSEAQTGATAAQMGAAGLQGMVQESGKVHESQLNKALTAIDWKQNMLSMEQLGASAQMQSQASTNAGMTSALAQIGSSWVASKSANN